MIKKLITIIFLITIIPSVLADDYYATSGKNILSNNFKILLEENVISDILIDNNSIYFFTLNNLYSSNKSLGVINYKVNIYNLKNIAQSNDYIFVSTDTTLYKINKSDGFIIDKTIYSFLNKIYSVYGISSSEIINNYYDYINYYNYTGINSSICTESPAQYSRFVGYNVTGYPNFECYNDDSGEGITDHGLLTGLDHNDHTQYTLNTTFINHTINYNNPHVVTASQVITGNIQAPISPWEISGANGDAKITIIDDGSYSRTTTCSSLSGNEACTNVDSQYVDGSIFDSIGNGVEYIFTLSYFMSAIYNELGSQSKLYQYFNKYIFTFDEVTEYSLNSTTFDMNGNNITNNPQITALQAGKVNKSGDNMTGLLRVNVTNPYTGGGLTLLEFGRNSTASKGRATLNDANGAFNFRVNIKDDLTQDITTGSGWSFAMQPVTHMFTVTRIIPGTTTPENIIQLSGTEQLTNGRIYLGSGSNTSRYPVTIYNLSGAGNAYACLDSAGTLYRSNATCV